MVKAVCVGNRGVLLKLINRGRNVNQPVRYPNGDVVPLLVLAAMGGEPGHLSVAALLLDRGKCKRWRAGHLGPLPTLSAPAIV